LGERPGTGGELYDESLQRICHIDIAGRAHDHVIGGDYAVGRAKNGQRAPGMGVEDEEAVIRRRNTGKA
jgi:hypothetical protein